MKKPGRPGVSHLSVVSPDLTGSRPALTPLQRLAPDEKAIFDFLVAEHVHLRRGDVPLIMGLARASAALFKTDSVADYERLGRLCLSYSTRLRISPQARVRAETLTRMQQREQPLSYYERQALLENDDGQ
jgi:hypothetical protein